MSKSKHSIDGRLILAVFLAIVVVIAVIRDNVTPNWSDGSFSGEAMGFKDVVRVMVTIESGKIVEVTVVEHSETPILSEAAIGQIPQAIVEKQTWKVDAISGATYTSRAVMVAVEAALAQAIVNNK